MKKKLRVKKIKEVDAKSVSLFVFTFVYLYLFLACIYKYIKTSDIISCRLEIVFVLTLSIIIYFLHFIKFFGTNKKKPMNKKGRIKQYFNESIFLSLIVTTIFSLLVAFDKIYIDFYSMIKGQVVLSILLVMIGVFIGMFILFFIGNYYISEKSIKESK